MKRAFNILIITMLYLMTSCTKPNTKSLEKELWNKAKESMEIGDVFTYILMFPNSEKLDTCINQLNSYVIDATDMQLISYQAIDSINRKSWFGFSNTDDDCADYYLKKKNCFILTITDNGAFHDSSKIASETIKHEIKGYLTNHYDEPNYPQSKVSNVKYFGPILVSKLCIVIDTDLSSIDADTKINWKLYFETLQGVKAIYEQIWNDKSQEVWQMEFKDLEFEKQLAILDCFELRIELNFIKRTFERE